MSLDWNLTKIPDCDTLCFDDVTEDSPTRGLKAGDRVLSPVTNAIIWLTMHTGIGWGLTDENIEEFVARVSVWESLNGPMCSFYDADTDRFEPKPLDPDVLRAHVGLYTNVSYKPRAEWLEHLFRTTFPKTEPGDAQGREWYVAITFPNGNVIDYEVTATDTEGAERAARARMAADYTDPDFTFVTYTVEEI